MTPDDHPLPIFVDAVRDDGRLRVTWPAFAAPRAACVVSLRAADTFSAADFWSGAVDNDLIRVPVDARAGAAELFVPAGRPVSVTLVARDAAGDRVTTPTLTLAVQAAQDPRADEPGPPAKRLGAPVAHDHGPSDRVPLIFVEGEAAPDLEALARRVALQAEGARPAAAALRGRPPGGAFGMRQKWTLARLSFPRDAPGPRVVVRRDQFINATELATWRDAPPADALPLDPRSDGLIDGDGADGDLRFYAVMQGPAPWQPLPLQPVAPPFETVRQATALGDAAARLAATLDAQLAALDSQPIALSDLEVRLGLIEAATRWLPQAHPLRVRMLAAVATRGAGERF